MLVYCAGNPTAQNSSSPTSWPCSTPILTDPGRSAQSMSSPIKKRNLSNSACSKKNLFRYANKASLTLLLCECRLERAAVLILSSRISYEPVQRGARTRIPIVLAKFRPTALVLDLTVRLNMIMASASGPSGLYVYCGGQRLILNLSPAFHCPRTGVPLA
ncbi:MAG: formate dehydrogenase accessory sulfurtransferase FdhD [Desulfobacterales bacterium]